MLDSGTGVLNTLNYLKEFNISDDIRVIIDKKNRYYGDKTNKELKGVFSELKKEYNLKKNNTFICCNTLNSVINNYKGAYNTLKNFLDVEGDNIILATDRTSKNLIKDGYSLFNRIKTLPTTIPSNIDYGVKPNININTQKSIILGCTHYDLINIHNRFNSQIYSTSKMCAYEIKKNMRFKKDKVNIEIIEHIKQEE